MKKNKLLWMIPVALASLSMSAVVVSCSATKYDFTYKPVKRDSEIKQINEKIYELRNKIAKAISQFDHWNKQIDENKEAATKAKEKLDKINKVLNPLQAERDEIDKQRLPLVEKIKELEENNKTAQLEKIAEDLKLKESNLNSLKQNLKTYTSDLELSKIKFVQITNHVKKLESQIAQINSEISTLNEQINALGNVITDSDNTARINVLSNEISKLESQLQALKEPKNIVAYQSIQRQIKSKEKEKETKEKLLESLSKVKEVNLDFQQKLAALKTIVETFIKDYELTYPEIAKVLKNLFFDSIQTVINENTILEANEQAIPILEKNFAKFFNAILTNKSVDISSTRIDSSIIAQIKASSDEVEKIRAFKPQFTEKFLSLVEVLKKLANATKETGIYRENTVTINSFTTDIANKIEQYSHELNTVTNTLIELNKQLSENSKLKTDINEIEVKRIESNIQNKKDELATLKKSYSATEKQQELRTNLQNQINEKNTLIQELTAKKQEEENQKMAAAAEKIRIETKIEELNTQITSLTSETDNLKAEKEKLGSEENTAAEIIKIQNQLIELNKQRRSQEAKYHELVEKAREISVQNDKVIKLESQAISGYNNIQRSLNSFRISILEYIKQLRRLNAEPDKDIVDILKELENKINIKNSALTPLPDDDNSSTSPNPDNGNNTGPGLPIGIPTFPIQSFEKENSYPDYANRYQPVDALKLYKEIWDRTFSIQYTSRVNEDGENIDLGGNQGTAWLLDYHKVDGNNYKLYFATNMHVLWKFSNSMKNKELQKEWKYEDPTGDELLSFSLGKSTLPSSFAAIPNNETAKYFNERGGAISYYTNSTKENTNMIRTTGFTTPQLIFGAVGFMKDEVSDQFSDIINQKWNDFKEKNQGSGSVKNTGIIDWKEKNPNEKIPFYADFGVFELDVNLSQCDEKLRGWITGAIDAINSYITRIKNTASLPNIDKANNNILPTLDYWSKGLNLANDNPSNQFGLSNAKNIYIAGYPRNEEGTTMWMQNNPTERNSSDTTSYLRSPVNNKAFAFPTNVVTSPMQNNNIQIYTEVWNRPFLSFYGGNYSIRFSSLYFGASGSMVYNDFGELIGIYSSAQANVKFGDLMKSAGFTPFLQVGNIPTEYDKSKFIYGYNLIDGNGYSMQKNSYRQNLAKIYEGQNFSTALFPNGVEKK